MADQRRHTWFLWSNYKPHLKLTAVSKPKKPSFTPRVLYDFMYVLLSETEVTPQKQYQIYQYR